MHTIGADPELFLRDNDTGGVITAIGLVGGTKEEPRPIPGMEAGFAVQEDNVMLEFNIPPAYSTEEFNNHISRALDGAIGLIRIRHPNVAIDFAPARAFSAAQLDHKQARVFGCAPDFDAHTHGTPLTPPSPRRLQRDDGTAWRFAGGHVHLGGYGGEVPPHVVAQFCDVFLGLPSVALDKQGARRKMYGTAGRFRPTWYGIEYRTLSNFWVFDENLRHEIGERAFQVMRAIEDEDAAHAMFLEVPWQDVRAAINNEDEALAADLIAYVRNDIGMEV